MNPERGKTDIRILKALAVGRGDIINSLAFAEGQGPGWRDAAAAIRLAAVGGQSAAGDGSLIGPVGADLLALVRPATIAGRLPLRPVPFNTMIATTLTGSGANWPGEGKSAPLTKATYARLALTLAPLRVMALAVVTEELARSAAPNAEVTLGQDFIAACVQAADVAFIDPQNAGVASAKPAAVTNGAPAFASSGITASQIDGDLGRLIESLVARGSTLLSAYWVLHPLTASGLARVVNSNGDRAYPLLSVRGGELLGLPVITSASVPHVGSPQSGSIVLLDASRVWLAEDPAMVYEASVAATLQMLDNPTNDAVTPTATTMVSMFQTNAVALRGTRFLNWKIAEAGACAVLNGVAF